jgi:DNA-binding IclR family transcriptional regulator
VLTNLHALAEQHADQRHGHSTEVLRAMMSYTGGVRRTLDELESRGLVRQSAPNQWSLTERGVGEAERVAHAAERQADS